MKNVSMHTGIEVHWHLLMVLCKRIFVHPVKRLELCATVATVHLLRTDQLEKSSYISNEIYFSKLVMYIDTWHFDRTVLGYFIWWKCYFSAWKCSQFNTFINKTLSLTFNNRLWLVTWPLHYSYYLHCGVPK